MVISELIKELQKEYGDIGIFTIFNTYGTGEWVPLEDSGISFDRYNIGENILYIGW